MSIKTETKQSAKDFVKKIFEDNNWVVVKEDDDSITVRAHLDDSPEFDYVIEIKKFDLKDFNYGLTNPDYEGLLSYEGLYYIKFPGFGPCFIEDDEHVEALEMHMASLKYGGSSRKFKLAS